MKKYSLYLRSISIFNGPFVQLLALPIIVAISVAAIPIFWKADLQLKNRTTARKMLVSPSPEIVVITIDNTDDEMYRERIGGPVFKGGASLWRKAHADIINKIASINKGPKSIGFDITFHSRHTEFDQGLIESIINANIQNINIVLGMNSTPLDKDHWVYSLYKDGIIQLGSVYADAYDDLMVKGYVLKDYVYFNDDTTSGKEIPSLAVALFSANYGLSSLPEQISVKLVKEKFTNYNYRDIIEEDRFLKIKDSLENKVIIVGMENPLDKIGFPYIPKGQPKIDKDHTYGVYYHANALNYMFYREHIKEVDGPGKVFLIFVSAIIINGLYLLLKKHNIFLKTLVLILIIVIANIITFNLDYALPLVSINVGILTGLFFTYLPEVYLFMVHLRLNKLQDKYEYMAKDIYRQKKNMLNKPCQGLLEISEYVNNLNKIFVESEGHTWYEEIPARYLQKLDLLVPEYKLSKKRSDCIGRADYVKEEFVGTRIRRMRNYLAHANLKDHVVKLAIGHIYYYSGKNNYLALRAPNIYKMQVGVMMELLEYLKSINREIR